MFASMTDTDRPQAPATKQAAPVEPGGDAPVEQGDTPFVPAETSFGFRRVGEDEHPSLVRGVFDSVADQYDLMNDLMSGGLHRLWKAEMLDWLKPRPGTRLIDMGGGTGDIGFGFLERAGGAAAGSHVTITDINASMLSVAVDRAADRGLVSGLDFVCANAEALPFPDRGADACTIAFALRNVTRRDLALAEAHRVLKPGGHFICLEFSHVVLPLLAKLYDRYSFNVLPLLGRIVANDEESYRYLAESIRMFPDQETLAEDFRAAGFENVRYRNLSAGIVALHSGWRV